MKNLLSAAAVAMTCAAPAAADEIVVTMDGATYTPEQISASAGDTIRFVNDDGADHNVFVATAGFSMDLGKLEPGTDVEFVLRRVGSFEVECVFHPGMTMQVEVQG